MDLHFLWEAAVILPFGMVLLRVAGKKTLSEMTSIEIISTLCVGTLISHAISEEGLWKTITTMSLVILILIIMQFVQFHVRWFENLFIGKPTIVVEESRILDQNLKKLRMTNRQLEMRLRQLGITDLSKVKTATIEANGQLGWELYPKQQAITGAELEEIMKRFQIPAELLPNKEQDASGNLFWKAKQEEV